MNDKGKQYKELAIVFTLLAAILIISYFILKEVSYPYASIALLVVGGILAIAAVICWILFGVKLKKSKVEQTAEQQAAREFTKWLENFDHLTKTAAELVPVDDEKKVFPNLADCPSYQLNLRGRRRTESRFRFCCNLIFRKSTRTVA